MQIKEIRIEAGEALVLFPYKSLKSEIALTFTADSQIAGSCSFHVMQTFNFVHVCVW